MGIKLKDYKKHPEQYNKIISMCKNSRISPDDEDDAIELFDRIKNAEIEYVKNVATKAIKNYQA